MTSSISKFTPEMMMEEIFIAIETGRCPRCAAILDVHIKGDDFEIHCPGCDGYWAGGGPWGDE